MELLKAINQLRPHLAIRDNLRLLLTHPSNDMYFATIPRDICNIILDLVPDLRQNSSQHYMSVLWQYNEFVNKYDVQIGSDHQFSRIRNRNKFMTDFNLTGSINEIKIKCIDEHTEIDVFKKFRSTLQINKFTFLESNDDNANWYMVTRKYAIARKKHMPNLSKITKGCNINTWLLPCGLFVLKTSPRSQSNKHPTPVFNTYLVDPDSDTAIPIVPLNALMFFGSVLVDDFGHLIQVALTKEQINFSKLSCDSVVMKV